MGENFYDIYKTIKDIILNLKWYRKSTLFILLLFVFGLLVWFFSGAKVEEISSIECIIIILALIITFTIWYYQIRIPRNKKGYVGFIVALSAETKEHYEKIVQDFIYTLRDLLSKGELANSFKFIVLPEHHASKIEDTEDARRFLKIIKGHFMIYGRARVRSIKNENRHVLNMNGIVLHKPIPKRIGKTFAKEFSELFPTRLQLSSQDDLFLFDVTSELVNVVARYIIGIASYLSSDIDYSENIFEELEDNINNINTNFPAVIKIKRRIPEWLINIYITKTQIAYFNYRDNGDEKYLNDMENALFKVDRRTNYNYNCKIYWAIFHFIKNRNTQLSKSFLRKCKNEEDIMWRFNLAFIHAYEGDMKSASQQYWIAFKGKSIPQEKLLEIEEFISWILELEPDKVQLYYCLGVINYYAKEDKIRSLKDFEKFLEEVPSDKFEFQQERSAGIIEKIRKELREKDVNMN